MSKFYLEVVGDYNDADYVTSRHCIKASQIGKIKAIIRKMKSCEIDNYDEWETKYPDLTEEELNYISGFVPSAPDAMNVHSIESVKLLEVVSEKSLW